MLGIFKIALHLRNWHVYSAAPVCEGEDWIFELNKIGGTEIFQNQGGKKKRGKGEFLKFSLGENYCR